MGAHRAPDPDETPLGFAAWEATTVVPTSAPPEETTALPTADQLDVPTADQLDVPTADQLDVPTADQPDVPTADQPDVPADQPDVPATTPPPDVPDTPPESWAATTVIPTPTPGAADRPLLVRYLTVCAILLAVLVAVVVWATFFTDDGVSVSATNSPTSAAPTTTEESDATDTPTETATDTATVAAPPPAAGNATDGPIDFTIHGAETGPSVTSADGPVTKTAQGQYVVVHMTVRNVGEAPATFLGTLQKLKAAGQVYSIDDEATFYVGGGVAELNPGDQADVAVAFDVPPGTAPETLEVHGDPASPGTDVPLT